MNPIQDLSNQKFGKLTALKMVGKTKCRNILWLCKCECNNTKIVRGSFLRNSTSTHCGCSHPTKLAHGKAAFKSLVHVYKLSAKKRKLKFTLSEDVLSKLFKNNCSLCNSPPLNYYINGGNNGGYYYNGIDRIDNNKGYTKNNVQTMCKRCNYAKRDCNNDEFMIWLKRLVNFNKALID